MTSSRLTTDILKLAMVLMVVGRHAHFLHDLSPLGEYLTVNGLFRMAIPVLLLISGHAFFNASSQHTPFEMVKRLVMLYVFWMLAYLYFWLPPLPLSAAWLKKVIMTGFFGFYHLWYVAGLIGAMLVLLAVHRLSTRVLLAGVMATFLAGVFTQYAGNYDLLGNEKLHRVFMQNLVHRNFLLFCFPFFCIGYLIGQRGIAERLSRHQAGWLSLIGVAALLAESFFNYTRRSEPAEFDTYLTLMLACPALLLWCLKTDIRARHNNVDLYASAIYLVHVFFVISLGAIAHDRLGETALTGIVIALSVIASYFVIKLNRQVKFIL